LVGPGDPSRSRAKEMIARLLVALPCIASGLLNDGSKLGQTLAHSIMKSLQSRTGAGSDFQESLMETMNSKQEVLTSPEISQAVALANSLAEHHLPMDRFCERAWSQPCPDGWQHSARDACLAPKSYQGGCGTLQSFDSAGVSAKAEFAATCKAPWPCSGAVCKEGHEYDECPIGFEQLGGGLCQQSNSSLSACASFISLNMEIAQKQELAKDCGLQWSCKASCEQDFSAQCPEGWVSAMGLCSAPSSYAGTCGYSVDTTTMMESEKQAFALSCDVQFPCVGSGIRSTTTEKLQPPKPITSKSALMESTKSTDRLPKEWFGRPDGPF